MSTCMCESTLAPRPTGAEGGGKAPFYNFHTHQDHVHSHKLYSRLQLQRQGLELLAYTRYWDAVWHRHRTALLGASHRQNSTAGCPADKQANQSRFEAPHLCRSGLDPNVGSFTPYERTHPLMQQRYKQHVLLPPTHH